AGPNPVYYSSREKRPQRTPTRRNAISAFALFQIKPTQREENSADQVSLQPTPSSSRSNSGAKSENPLGHIDYVSIFDIIHLRRLAAHRRFEIENLSMLLSADRPD